MENNIKINKMAQQFDGNEKSKNKKKSSTIFSRI